MRKILIFILALFIVPYISSQNSNAELTIRNFLNQPLEDSSIILPNMRYYNFAYNSFEELFAHIGNPIGEFPTNHPGEIFEGNFASGFIFRYFSIGTIYSASRDQLWAFFISFNLDEDIIFSNGITRHDSPQKIRSIFGDPTSINRMNSNVIEYSYSADFRMETLAFQFTNSKLTAIIIIIM